MGNRASIGLQLRLSKETPLELISLIRYGLKVGKDIWNLSPVQQYTVANHIASIIHSSSRGYASTWNRNQLIEYTDEYALLIEAASKGDVWVEDLLENLSPYLLKESKAIVIHETGGDGEHIELWYCEENGKTLTTTVDVELDMYYQDRDGHYSIGALDWTAAAIWKHFNQLRSTNQKILDFALTKITHISLMSRMSSWWLEYLTE